MISEQTITVTQIIEETPDTKTLRFHVPESIPFLPGQFGMLGVTLPGEEKVNKRAYSFSSSPLKDHIELTIKKEFKGKVSHYLVDQTKVGNAFTIKAPFGLFKFDNDAIQEIALIGAGSGIAPLRSILHYILDKKLPITVNLFFTVKTQEDIIYKKELKELHKKHDNFSYHQILTKKGPRINHHLITENTKNPDLFYICGPPGMVNDIKKQLEDKGIDKTKIKVEKW